MKVKLTESGEIQDVSEVLGNHLIRRGSAVSVDEDEVAIEADPNRCSDTLDDFGDDLDEVAEVAGDEEPPASGSSEESE